MRVRSCLVFLIAAMSASEVYGQSPAAVTAPVPLPVTVPFQQKAALAFSPLAKVPVAVTVSGSATWVSGAQHDSGTLQLKVLADGSITETWSFSTISHSLTQSGLGPTRKCVYSSSTVTEREIVGPNCIQAVPWFFPGFVFQPVYSAVAAIADVTAATDTSNGVDKLTYAPSLAAVAGASPAVLKTIARLEKSTVVSVEYDAQTALPNKLVYRQALDSDELQTIEVAILFSSYSAESGLMVPHHIQRFVQRTLQLDLNVTGVSIQ